LSHFVVILKSVFGVQLTHFCLTLSDVFQITTGVNALAYLGEGISRTLTEMTRFAATLRLGATTLSIMTFSIMTLRIIGLFATFNITLSIIALCKLR
jgi:hypothetical protein